MKKKHSLASILGSRSLREALSVSITAMLGFSSCSGSDVQQPAPAGAATSLSRSGAAVRGLPIQLRDSETGLGIQGLVAVRQKSTGLLLGRHEVAMASASQLEVPQEAALLQISAPGHQPLETNIEAGELLPTTVLLDPEAPAAEMSREAILGQVKEGFAMLHGHVVSAASGAPIEGATVRLADGLPSTQTNGRGYFTLHAPVAKTAPDELPAAESLIVEKAGYKTFTLSRTLLAAGATHFAIDLVAGAGKTASDDMHKIAQAEAGPLPDIAPPAEVAAQAAASPVVGVVAVPLKSSIRVGTSCSCTTCSGVSVLSAETYVKRGLNDEWIASWDADSLRAGAVAYRSYGQWYAYHPIKSSYDICSSTCCQVNDSDTHTNTDQAVNDTASVVVQKSGAVFRSEYAAENNGNACANGYTGDPAASWPCMADSTCKGSTFNGHGRGMCQWGSQRWATSGKDWVWILNHYYNNNGSPSGARSATIGNH